MELAGAKTLINRAIPNSVGTSSNTLHAEHLEKEGLLFLVLKFQNPLCHGNKQGPSTLLFCSRLSVDLEVSSSPLISKSLVNICHLKSKSQDLLQISVA